MQENKPTKWHKCYDDGWKGIIVPEAFSHPAKMSYGLLKRILAHAKEQGWLKEMDVICDPFGGIATTGILGAYEGYQCVMIELEGKFCKLAEQNFKLHKLGLHKLGLPYPVILQGDSRRLCEIIEKADIVVSSPPYAGALGNRKHEGDQQKYFERQKRYNEAHPEYKRPSAESMCYPCSEGNLAAMKPGNVDCILSSPPYAESLIQRTKRPDTKNTARMNEMKGNLTYGQSKQNLGNLKSGDVDLVLSSPPYEDAVKTGEGPGAKIWSEEKGHWIADPNTQGKYGEDRGNLGNNKGDTFWSAAKIIVQQCHQILKPGGHAIWVVKSFVRSKKIVDFPGDWQRLCEAAGFKTVCIHHAMLVKETKHKTLFGHTEVKRIERKSFFRRLAEAKGSPPIDFEVVLCMVKETPK